MFFLVIKKAFKTSIITVLSSLNYKNSFDLHSCGSEQRKIDTLRLIYTLLLMFPETAGGLEPGLPGGDND